MPAGGATVGRAVADDLALEPDGATSGSSVVFVLVAGAAMAVYAFVVIAGGVYMLVDQQARSRGGRECSSSSERPVAGLSGAARAATRVEAVASRRCSSREFMRRRRPGCARASSGGGRLARAVAGLAVALFAARSAGRRIDRVAPHAL